MSKENIPQDRPRVNLEEIRARCEAATPGPWKVVKNRHPETTGQAWGCIEGPAPHWCWTDKYKRERDYAPYQDRLSDEHPLLVDEPDRPEHVPANWLWKPANLDEGLRGFWDEPEDEAKARATGFCLKCYISIYGGCVTTFSGD